MTGKLLILIVLYNKRIKDIRSLDNFFELEPRENISIIIGDNSDNSEVKAENELQANTDYKDKIIYIDNNGNIGLSKAYNKVLPMVGDNDYIMLSDDDTLFSSEYLDNVIKCIENKRSNIISGIVTTGNGYMSPVKEFKVRFCEKDFIKQAGLYTNVYAINSGLVLSKQILNDIKAFPEQLFLDMIDYWLMETLIKLNKNTIEFVSGKIEQSFSGEAKYSAGMINRYKIYKKDVKQFAKLFPQYRSKCRRILFNRKLSIFLKRIKCKQ